MHYSNTINAERLVIACGIALLFVLCFASGMMGQIIVDRIDPGRITTPEMKRQDWHLPPMERQIPYSKPNQIMPRFFKDDRLKQTPIYLQPPTFQNFTFERLDGNRLKREAFQRGTIVMKNIKPPPIRRDILGPARIEQQASIPSGLDIRTDPTMEGFSKPTIRMGSSIFLLPREPAAVREYEARENREISSAEARLSSKRDSLRTPLGW